MNYIKHYIKLMKRARSRKSVNGYTEKHHIFPVSIFGANQIIVILTAKEHFIAHFLLWKACKRRYGIDHYRTKKMHFAFNQMTWNAVNHERYVSNSFQYARKCSSVYNIGNNNPSKRIESRIKIAESKLNKIRSDMIGKKYFGANTETILAVREKIRIKKTGKRVENYPKNRKTSPRSGLIARKISESRLKTKEKYIQMTEAEFANWLSKQNPLRKDGRLNPNVTRAVRWRNKIA